MGKTRVTSHMRAIPPSPPRMCKAMTDRRQVGASKVQASVCRRPERESLNAQDLLSSPSKDWTGAVVSQIPATLCVCPSCPSAQLHHLTRSVAPLDPPVPGPSYPGRYPSAALELACSHLCLVLSIICLSSNILLPSFLPCDIILVTCTTYTPIAILHPAIAHYLETSHL
jgi:hypothetical protein